MPKLRQERHQLSFDVSDTASNEPPLEMPLLRSSECSLGRGSIDMALLRSLPCGSFGTTNNFNFKGWVSDRAAALSRDQRYQKLRCAMSPLFRFCVLDEPVRSVHTNPVTSMRKSARWILF